MLNLGEEKVVSFGLFSPKHWPSHAPDRRVDPLIYGALKKAGFRETIWQYILKDQCGGLVLPLPDGVYELHVHFFNDGRITAEVELCRRLLGHFLSPGQPAEAQVLDLIKPFLSPEELARARAKFRQAPSSGTAGVRIKAMIPLIGITLTVTLLVLGLANLGYLSHYWYATVPGAITALLNFTLPAASAAA